MPTVVELKKEAKKHGVKLPHNATKDEIIKKLEAKGSTTMETKHEKDSDKNDKDKDEKGKSSSEGGNKSAKSGETRSFQTGPDTHESLTRSEAEKRGFHWGDIESAQVGRTLAPAAPPGNEKATK